MIPLWCRDSFTWVRGCRLWLLALVLTEALSTGLNDASQVHAETKVIPSVSLSQRYDTNVFFAPRSFVPSGTKLWDFVTTATPQVEFLNKNQLADTSIRAGVGANAFVNNSDLAFFSTNVDAYSKLDGLVSRLLPGAKLLVSESYRYTPEPPAFLTGGKPPPTADPFTRGLQGFRANTFANIAGAQGSYAVTRNLSVRGDYSYSLFRVGTFFVQSSAGGPTFFDTNIQRWSIGPSLRLTRGDTITLKYQDTHMNQTGAGTQGFSFTTRAVLAEYVMKTSDWTATLTGGGTLLEQGNDMFASGGIVLAWNYDRSTKLQVSGSRDIAPATFGTGGALISNTMSMSIEHRLSKVLSLSGNANYAYSQTAPVKLQTFESYAVAGSLRYFITRQISTSLTYSYSFFGLTSPQSAPFEVPRQFVMFSLDAKWE